MTHFGIFWEMIIGMRNIFGGWTGTENGIFKRKRINYQSSVVFKEVINIKVQKSSRSRKYLRSGRYNLFHLSSFFYFILCYIILLLFFTYLLIYLKLTLEKIPSSPPLQGSLLPPFSRVATSQGTSQFFLSYRLWRLWKFSAKSLLAFTKEMNNPKRKWPFLTKAEDKDLNERKNWKSLRD